jgi:hypothetical protein
MIHRARTRYFREALINFAAIFLIVSVGPVESAAPQELTAPAPKNLLTKHEDETFKNQTVYISGQAFIRCKFAACTLVLRESVYHLEGCTFERCNWHIDCLIGWGNNNMLGELKALVTMIEQAQKQQEQQKP